MDRSVSRVWAQNPFSLSARLRAFRCLLLCSGVLPVKRGWSLPWLSPGRGVASWVLCWDPGGALLAKEDISPCPHHRSESELCSFNHGWSQSRENTWLRVPAGCTFDTFSLPCATSVPPLVLCATSGPLCHATLQVSSFQPGSASAPCCSELEFLAIEVCSDCPGVLTAKTQTQEGRSKGTD